MTLNNQNNNKFLKFQKIKKIKIAQVTNKLFYIIINELKIMERKSIIFYLKYLF